MMRASAQAAPSTPAWPAPVTHVSAKGASCTAERERTSRMRVAPPSTSSNDEAAPVREMRTNVGEDEETRAQVDVEEMLLKIYQDGRLLYQLRMQ